MLIDSSLPLFQTDILFNNISAHKHASEAKTVAQLVEQHAFADDMWQRVYDRAYALVEQTRQKRREQGGIDAFMSEYDLSSQEGIALMCLAEALLRVPDSHTIDQLIQDKICHGDWDAHLGKSESIFVNSATWSLALTGNILDPEIDSERRYRQAWRQFIARSSKGLVRQAVKKAMQVMGKHFVMAEDIASAIKRAGDKEKHGFSYSYDMLGEAAKTDNDALFYFAAYKNAIKAIGHTKTKNKMGQQAPGISIKLSALDPRYEVSCQQQVLERLLPRALELCQLAKASGVALTIDAEEADRLELSLVIFAELAHHQTLADWHGLGLAVQAYQKRAPQVLDWLANLGQITKRRIPVRLVKGAYWDSEIKHAQELGMSDYPVYTRKAYTDVSYLACARKLLSQTDVFYPQFATHNAVSIAAIIEMTENCDFEFQCLHGMGEAMYDDLIATSNNGEGKPYNCRIYAPVGNYQHLLPYLVRRLLENGANSSFVNRIANLTTPITKLISNPFATARQHEFTPHPDIPSPLAIYGDERPNSQGLDLTDPNDLTQLARTIAIDNAGDKQAQPLLADSTSNNSKAIPVKNPACHNQVVGEVLFAQSSQVESAVGSALDAFANWQATPAATRAHYLDQTADLLQQNMTSLIALAIKEAGKSAANAIAEVREAIDFCRYYAQQVREHFSQHKPLPGPTGELNYLKLCGRGVFVCISPWNFPLAIFTGEVMAALAAGNTVIAKPAEQTSLIASAAVELMHQAGIPRSVLQLMPGPGETVGAALVQDKRIAGVIFTGSTQVAKSIQTALNSNQQQIPTFIAETGGQNAMIVDSSALPEQVVTDVITSGFDSAGQRCSALRVLYLQQDIADEVLQMLTGAMDELKVGDPSILATDIGPVIDDEARQNLQEHIDKLTADGKLLHQTPLPADLPQGTYIAPTLFELEHINELQGEVFGPVIHVIRFQAKDLDQVIAQINSTGFGLTFGIHSRVQAKTNYVLERIRAGNLYVNRNIVGAIVGCQPFGGEGTSGTGPKAGGPYYLPRLATERAVSIDTTAAGGNASLMMLEQD